MEKYTEWNEGTVYLLHFSTPLHHAQHYIGWCWIGSNLEDRLKAHQIGKGAKIMKALKKAKISFQLARTWNGQKGLEFYLKKKKNAPKLCPICKELDEHNPI